MTKPWKSLVHLNTKCYASRRKVFSPKDDCHCSTNIDDNKNSDIITTQFIGSFKSFRDNVKDTKFLPRVLATVDTDIKIKGIDSMISFCVDNFLPLGSLNNENEMMNTEIKQMYAFLNSLQSKDWKAVSKDSTIY